MRYRSPFADVEIPDLSLTSYVLRDAGRYPDRPALIDGLTGRAITYGQLVLGVGALASGLRARGVRPRDVCAIIGANCLEYAIAFHGAASVGAAVTTVGTLATAAEAAHQLSDCGARVIFSSPGGHEKALEAARRAGIGDVIALDDEAGEGLTPLRDILDWSGRPPHVAIDPREHVVALPYSSGTTGMPKGVMLTHRNLIANIVQMVATGLVHDRDTLLAVLPFYHIYGMVVILNLGLARGATLVVLPRFEMETCLAVMERHRVSLGFVVPPIVLALARHPAVDRHDLSSVRVLFSGAAPLGEGLTHEVAARLGCAVLQGYGMTEASPATHCSPVERGRAKAGSAGVLLADTECRIVHVDTGADLGPHEEGELWVRGPQVMKGYLDRPEATARTLDRAGWLHTGDIGYADEEGHFFIVDRLKELIKYKGLQVPPAELEAVLLSHPSVADAAVIPMPDEEAGEVPKAYVALRSPATAEELMAFVAERVAPYKRIRQVAFIDEVPKSPSGKILRRVLVERERESGTAPSLLAR